VQKAVCGFAGQHAIAYDAKNDLLFFRPPMPIHANGMHFAAC